MNGFCYETHLHTSEVSHCSVALGSDYPKFYKTLGYQGIIVTDHFFNGNTTVPSYLPWEERIRRFCLGYEHTKKAANEVGLDVFFGLEWNYRCDEYLIYGPDKKWLLSHPDMLNWSHSELFERISILGGCVIQAHPFRERDYIHKIHLYPHHVHGIEVSNSGNLDQHDRLAYAYADYYGLPMISGTDIHNTIVPKRGIRGVCSSTRWTSIYDFIAQIKSDKGYQLITSPQSNGLLENDFPSLPISFYAENEKPISVELKKILASKKNNL